MPLDKHHSISACSFIRCPPWTGGFGILGLRVGEERPLSVCRVAQDGVDRLNSMQQVRARPSQGDRVGVDAIAQMRTYAAVAKHVNVSAKELFKVLPEPHKIEQAASSLHLD